MTLPRAARLESDVSKNALARPRARPWLFFLLTFALTWTFWLGMAALSGDAGPMSSPAARVLLFLGIFSPAFIAVALTGRAGGRANIVQLLGRLLQWDAPLRWYLFAIGYMTAVRLLAAVAYRWIAGAWPAFGFDSYGLMLLVTVFSTLVAGQAGEEVGWRGYALPALADRFGLRAAGIVVGVFWALWHLPLFFVTAADTYGQSLPLYVSQVVGFSVAMTWMYAHTRGSLLLAMLMHSAINNTKDIVPSVLRPPANPLTLDAPLFGWTSVAVVWVAAVYFLIRMPASAARE
jgi:membrane protease YdiL (CAAX protease family)